MSRWFRMYDDLLDDPKVQRLPADLFKIWVNLLCLASRNGGILPCVEDIAFALRIDMSVADQAIANLADRGLLDEGDAVRPHNWDKRQFKSDQDPTAAERQRAKRERDKQSANVRDSSEHVTRDKPVTSHPPETDTDTELDTGTSNEVPNKGRARKTGTTLPDDFEPDATCHAVADELRYTTEESRQAFDNFRDYWRAVPGAKGRKLDWQATFRNWLRNNHNRRAPRIGQNQQSPSRADKFAEFDALINARFRTGEDGEKRGQAFDVELSRQ